MANKNKRVSAAEILETLDLYFELQNCHMVGEKLGITGGSVLARLAPFGVVPKPVGNSAGVLLEDLNDTRHIARIRDYLERRIEWEKRNPFKVRRSEAVPAIELLSTVSLYFQLNSLNKVAQVLKIDHKTVWGRLKQLGINPTPKGVANGRAKDYNDMDEVARIMKRLHDEAEVEMTQAQ